MKKEYINEALYFFLQKKYIDLKQYQFDIIKGLLKKNAKSKYYIESSANQDRFCQIYNSLVEKNLKIKLLSNLVLTKYHHSKKINYSESFVVKKDNSIIESIFSKATDVMSVKIIGILPFYYLKKNNEGKKIFAEIENQIYKKNMQDSVEKNYITLLEFYGFIDVVIWIILGFLLQNGWDNYIWNNHIIKRIKQ